MLLLTHDSCKVSHVYLLDCTGLLVKLLGSITALKVWPGSVMLIELT